MKIQELGRAWMLAVALGTCALASMGCDSLGGSEKAEKDDDAKDDDDDKKKKSDDDDDDDEGSKDKAAKYETGDVLKHVPKDCKTGRFYVNIGLFLDNDAIAKTSDELEEKMVDAMGKSDAKEAKKFLKTLKKEGIDLKKDVKEMALCMNHDSDDIIVAFGGEFDGKDPLGAFIKASEAIDEEVSKKKKEDDVEYIKTDKPFIAHVAPNVIVITEEKDGFSDLAKEKDRSDDWDIGKGRIVSASMKEANKFKMDGQITEKSKKLNFKVEFEALGPDAAKWKENPEAIEKEFTSIVKATAKNMKKSPLKAIADDIDDVDLKVKGSNMTAKVTIPIKDLIKAIENAAEADEKELEKIFR